MILPETTQEVFPRDLATHPMPWPFRNARLIIKTETYQVVGNVFADVNFLKHFTLHTSGGGTFDNYYYNGFATTPYENAENNHAANLYTETYGQNSSLIWTNTLTYNNQIDKHSFTLLGGTEYIYNTGQGSNATRGNYYITDSSNSDGFSQSLDAEFRSGIHPDQ